MTGLQEYAKALKAGEKAARAASAKGEYPYLPALDEILSSQDVQSEIYLGLMDIPLEQIAGTRTTGRQNAFACNFMPLVGEKSEFAMKWSAVYDHQVEEGIHDPIEVYEFMNRYYVLEGNKRVSVLKYIGAYSIEATVTRIVPKLTSDKQVHIFYEYMEFYRKTAINYIWFSKEGSFAALTKQCGKGMDDIWTEEEKKDFSSSYLLFQKIFDEKGGKKLSITCADAFLLYLDVYPYRDMKNKSAAQIRAEVEKVWKEFPALEAQPDQALVLSPDNAPEANLFNRFFQGTGSRVLNVAFIYDKPVSESGWSYGHDLGRMHVEQKFGKQIRTTVYEMNSTRTDPEEVIRCACEDGNHIIFTTSERFLSASLKCAIKFPGIKILCCCVNRPYNAIRTYYGRMYEAKFLAGMIAGAMTPNDRIAYCADFPIYGSLAGVNAFARGALMTNPEAKVYLHWNSVPARSMEQMLRENEICTVCDVDMVRPGGGSRRFGLYRIRDGAYENLAAPIWNWGRFYEKIIRDIVTGSWKEEERSRKAVNYLWGISGGIIDLIVSQKVPEGLTRLVEIMRSQIYHGVLNPFEGRIRKQDGSFAGKKGEWLPLEEVITMDYLASNVIGTIPKAEELSGEALSLMDIMGIVKPENEQLRMPAAVAGRREDIV